MTKTTSKVYKSTLITLNEHTLCEVCGLCIDCGDCTCEDPDKHGTKVKKAMKEK